MGHPLAPAMRGIGSQPTSGFRSPAGSATQEPPELKRCAGFAHIPEIAPWLAEYLEMTVFPNGKHDDQADSTAQFLDWYKTPFAGQGIYEYYRRLHAAAEQRRKPQPA